MRPSDHLVHSRAQSQDRFALFPLEGYPLSRLPDWDRTEARILAGPAIGAEFAMYLLDTASGGGISRKADGEIETFFYLLNGEATLQTAGNSEMISDGCYVLIPPDVDYSLRVTAPSRALLLRKRYESVANVAMYKPVISCEADVIATNWNDNPHTRLQCLIPDELEYDLALNIFTFDPGSGLPYVETHVMEHGLYMLEGKGLYYLQDHWMEVQKDDFIWMGPFCPQSFYATGPAPAKYIYYKNVNREVAL